MNLRFALALLVAFSVGSASADPPSTSTTSPLWLALQVADPALGEPPGTLVLSATNRGEQPIRIVRARDDLLGRHQDWEGWSIAVEGPRGSYRPFVAPGPAPMPASLADVIELRRGESFGVRVQLRYWWGSKDAGIKQSDRPGLCSTPGRYTAVARFSGSGGPIIRDLAKDWLDRVPLPDQPPTQSLPLRFVLPPGACAARAGGVTCC